MIWPKKGCGVLPTTIDPASLPDIAHYRSHGIDRITVVPNPVLLPSGHGHVR